LDPVEIFGVNCNSTFSANLMIVKYSGTPTSLTKIKYVDFGRGVSIDEYHTKSATNVGHPNAAGAIATGSSAYFLTNPPVLNYYSSAGGVPILFKPGGTPIPGGILRAKPELTSVDGGDNTFFGSDYEPNGKPKLFRHLCRRSPCGRSGSADAAGKQQIDADCDKDGHASYCCRYTEKDRRIL
jgi:hypothetical protein